jgi:hypothetical protein
MLEIIYQSNWYASYILEFDEENIFLAELYKFSFMIKMNKRLANELFDKAKRIIELRLFL